MAAPQSTALLGGVSVLVVTGVACLRGYVLPGASLGLQIVGVVLLVSLLIGAWLLHRFIRNHGDEIGEARFDTRNKDERDG
jgi:membrane protein implicated in regulation of membrane protease activity